MANLNAAIRDIPIPHRMGNLPISDKGFPVPWFVHIDKNGPDFRIIGKDKFYDAMKGKRCWLCGQPLGKFAVFAIGPMCTINRISAEPPSHLDCATYAAKACPFLSNPKMRRNETEYGISTLGVAGTMIDRNPGVTALWVTRNYRLFQVSNGFLLDIGEPERVLWYKKGEAATRAEVEEAISSGLPVLEKEAETAEDRTLLHQMVEKAKTFLPKMETAP